MRLSAPHKNTWWIAVALGVLGLVGHLQSFPFISAYSFWLVFAGFALLAAGSYLKNL